MEELTPGTKISPRFHLTCYGCKNSHDTYSDMQFGTEVTKCRSLKDKLVPMVHPTVELDVCQDCRKKLLSFINDEREKHGLCRILNN